MWKRGLFTAVGALRHRTTPSGVRGAATMSSAVDTMVLRSLKEHYMEVAKMNMPPKVSPPSNFTIVKGALDSEGPVLKRNYGEEEISIYVMRLNNIGEEQDGAIDQLFIHVDVSKPEQKESLNFLCGLYEDALGIHSVSMRPKLLDSSGYILTPTHYTGPVFAELDEKMRDAFHSYIEERGVNDSLFKFLQAWLYVKEHRNLMRWFKTMGLFIDGKKQAVDA
ncbi:putative mitochondrial glycoprotein [Medicago truncatula]|uniref:Glycoprotein family protein n=1 Tax=Medicago truncatula TaxID=3880 RepID=G7K3J2_MEDTR|nr:mitochondrial acidic protein MAM33 [Medicago truncatula]AET00524.1 glycoprotein family protein [Medicago truncatula]RHN57800.1 putative mitochondrial glycoprotein [Medicago truncatula]